MNILRERERVKILREWEKWGTAENTAPAREWPMEKHFQVQTKWSKTSSVQRAEAAICPRMCFV